MSVENQILKSILEHKRGKIFFPASFIKFGSTMAVRQALNRLEKKKILLRLASGIYLYPKKHKVLGNLQPSIEDIAMAIAKRDKARIIPTGVQALNKLGLSEQVSMNAVYLTDGTPRIIRIGKRSIKFKIASPKLLAAKSEITLLVILALKEMGEENMDKKTLSKIVPLLRQVDTDLINYDMKLAPAWIAEIIKSVINKD